VPALSHALAGPSDVRAGALHGPSTEEVTRRSCNGVPGEPLPLPVALLHPARRATTAARTATRATDWLCISSAYEPALPKPSGQTLQNGTNGVACHANPDKLTASDKRKSGIFGEWQLSFLPTYFGQARTGGGALFRGVERTALEL
jgi:hypothetical protein